MKTEKTDELAQAIETAALVIEMYEGLFDLQLFRLEELKEENEGLREIVKKMCERALN